MSTASTAPSRSRFLPPTSTHCTTVVLDACPLCASTRIRASTFPLASFCAFCHSYNYCTPLGEPADEVCISRGVTTAVDAGSAGATTFEGFRKFAAEPAQTRLLCILNASMHGLASAGSTGGGSGGELDSLNQVQVEPLVKVIRENRDLCVGIKVRLSADAANNGKNEKEAYVRALQACELAGVPLMTHHTFSTVPLTECPGSDASPIKMRKGDLYTHAFHGFEVKHQDLTFLC